MIVNGPIKAMLIIAVLMLLANNACRADTLSNQQPEVYQPGYIDYSLRLVLVAKPSLTKACLLLEQGEMLDAEHLFAKDIKRDPNDYLGYVGFLQSAVGHRDDLLQRYEQDATDNPTPQNQFKLGILAFYMLGERIQKGVPTNNPERRFLTKEARYNLGNAYQQSHDPFVGLTEAASLPLTTDFNTFPIYEEIIREIGGEAVDAAYLKAKEKNWNAPLPPTPSVSKRDLVYLRWAVGGIDAGYGALQYTPSKTASGQVVYELDKSKYTLAQTRAMAYFDAWIAALRKAAT